MSGNGRPRVLFVARTSYRLPLGEGVQRKWDALERRLDLRVLASGTGSDERFELVGPRRLDGPRFYAALPFRTAARLRAFRPDAVVVQSPFEGVAVELARRVTRSPAKLIVEVHGDWRASTRLYGSKARLLVSPVADSLARWAVRRADAHRAISEHTGTLLRELGCEPRAVFPTYSDLDAFRGPERPLPDERQVLFVGVLERYKNFEVLAAAWHRVAREVPAAQLHLVGNGTQTSVAADLVSAGARWDPYLEPPDVARSMDRARVLVLPSAAEGLGRVVIESFLRGRPVIAARVGGLPELVEHEQNGLLVEPGDVNALADAITRVLADDELAARLARNAKRSGEAWGATADDYADRVRALVDSTLSANDERVVIEPVPADRFRARAPVV